MKRIFLIIAVFVSLFIINNLIHSIYTLWTKKDVVVEAQDELAREKERNLQLKKELEKVHDPLFKEKEVREKLFLVKPGEQVVLLPQGGEREASVTPQTKNIGEIPVWKQWINLFRGS